MSEGIDWINRNLEEIYGKDVSLNLPRYRIVWSSSQREKRLGTFEDWTEGGIYIRTVTEVREVPKYPLYEEYWVLEHLMFNNANPELTEKYSYEPLWVFGANGKGERQPLWKAVEILVHTHQYVKRKKTQVDVDIEEEIRFQKEKAYFKTIIQNESPYIAGCLADGAAVTVPHNYEKREDATD